ncbi:MAG: 30S ribosome-binding factor RbfA [Desulfosudaceae bacterium]
MKSYPRAERIGKKIQRRISEFLQQELRDPRISGVTVTGVDVSPDLGNAHIYYTVTGGKKEHREAAAGLKSASGFIKRSLAGRLDLKYMPAIHFYYDESIDYGERIDRLLKEI